MTASYEMSTRNDVTLEIHNVRRVRLRGEHLFFHGAGRGVEYVASIARDLKWVRRVPTTAEEAEVEAVELRNGRRWGDPELTIAGVAKIAVKRFEYESVFVLESDDGDLPAGYASAAYYAVNRVGQGPEQTS